MNVIEIVISVLAVVTGIGTVVIWLKGWWRWIGRAIWVKIFNRFPMTLDLFAIIKYNVPPKNKITPELFKKIKQDLESESIRITKGYSRPEILKLEIREKISQITYPILIKIEEEYELTTISSEHPEIISYNLNIEFMKKGRIPWSDLNTLSRFHSYFEKIRIIAKSSLFNDLELRQYFFTCTVFREFKIRGDLERIENTEMGARIYIKEKKIELNGDNLMMIVPLIKKYYLLGSSK